MRLQISFLIIYQKEFTYLSTILELITPDIWAMGLQPFKACSNSSICYDCRYEFKFQIFDENNNLVIHTVDTIDFETSSCDTSFYSFPSIDSIDVNYVASILNDTLTIGLSAQKQ